MHGMQWIQRLLRSVLLSVALDTLVDTAGEAEAELSSQLGTLLTSAGMTCHEYADCDQELATSQTVEDDWERNLLASLNEEQTSDISDDNELDNTPNLKVKMAANHLCELRDFAIAHKKPDLLQLVTKSQTIVEETMWDEIKTAKQTKITSFMN